MQAQLLKSAESMALSKADLSDPFSVQAFPLRVLKIHFTFRADYGTTKPVVHLPSGEILDSNPDSILKPNGQ